MARSRLQVLIPWVALACLARVWLAPGDAALLATPPDTGSAVEECSAHGCGCPHGRALAECCCVDDGSVEAPRPARRVARARTLVASASVAPLPDGEPTPALMPFPPSTIDSFECAGGQGDQAAPGPRRAPLGFADAPAALPVWGAEGWPPVEVCGLPYDHGSEPATPPPRVA